MQTWYDGKFLKLLWMWFDGMCLLFSTLALWFALMAFMFFTTGKTSIEMINTGNMLGNIIGAWTWMAIGGFASWAYLKYTRVRL